MRTWMAVIALACAFSAQAAPKVAVTDLAYQAQVEEYIHSVSAHNSGQASPYSASHSASYSEYESSKSYIEQTELRNFGGDIKGAILKSGLFQLVQGKPYTTGSSEDVYDVIARIKAGAFPGADYVLFGTLRPRVVREVSRELGMDVARQLAEQLTGEVPAAPAREGVQSNLPPDEPAQILR
ncbi:MAG: hypothetical protein EOP15_13330 [Pseudomonas sp.]|nr:MAG: hypothetical protein EOP15_13330 [Pseudomonas sp.]